MKRLITQFIISFFLIIFNFSFQISYNIHDFNTNNVIRNINYLCSDNFKGRLTGTIENKQIEEYIKLKFIENNLKPFIGDYIQSFKTNYPKKICGRPYLIISNNKDKIIKEFTYNKDYKEDMLNFKNNKFTFNKLNPEIIYKKNMLQITQNSDKFLFYVPSKNDIDFRSSFIDTSKWSMCIIVTQDTLNCIKEYLNEGYNINCFIPFTIKQTTAKNVMGYIKGKNPNQHPIIISAHFDHLGTDLDGNIYRGALDNASGTSFMLELIKYISSLGIPNRDILFVGFNAEEFGCIGSREFVLKYKNFIQNSKVFNFDMIGSDKGIPLCIVGSKKDSLKTSFLRNVSNTCTNEKIHFNYIFENDSDHAYFRKNNIDAITLCDNDKSKIHSLKDNPEFISPSAINRCFNIVSKEIINYAFNNNKLLLYYKEALIASSIIIIFTLYNFYKKYKFLK